MAKKKLKMDHDETKHIEQLDQADLKSTMVDTYWSIREEDILCSVCMKENSTVKEKKTLIFTKNDRSKCSIQFRFLKKQNKPATIQDADTILSDCSSKSVSLGVFRNYVETRSSVQDILYDYYCNETISLNRFFFLWYKVWISCGSKEQLILWKLFCCSCLWACRCWYIRSIYDHLAQTGVINQYQSRPYFTLESMFTKD